MLPDPLIRFLEVNPQLSAPVVEELESGRYFEFAKNRKHVGWYRVPKITIFPSLCTKPGTGYSWPGHISDRTVLGVYAHELGHHAHFTRPDFEQIRADFPRKHSITGYEPNVDESFAETFRLFVLNPDLLKNGRSTRYEYMLKLGFIPSETRDYREVLKDMRPHMWMRIVPWITRGD